MILTTWEAVVAVVGIALIVAGLLPYEEGSSPLQEAFERLLLACSLVLIVLAAWLLLAR